MKSDNDKGEERARPASAQKTSPETVRLDKWLWAVRLYKTRTLATDACRAGHVKILAQPAKPAHPIRVGQVITVQFGPFTRTVRVLGAIEQRIGAALASRYVEDLTSASEYQKHDEYREHQKLLPHPATRPTKKDRRALEQIKRWFESPAPEES